MLLLLPTWLLAQTTAVTYTPLASAIANPERGFYHFTETWSSAHTPLQQSVLSNLRNGYTSFGSNYTTPVTLALRVVYLDQFISSPISGAFLSALETDFNTARAAGVKLILRFAYNQDVSIPYNEPSKAQILAHVAQLQPLFAAHSDVILTLHAGFVGAWGEWYYTTVFGDASQSPYQYSAANWQDRVELINALLAALPADRTVQVRTPQTKQKHAHGVNAPTNLAATGGRVGHHNDCFLAPYNDYGTYNNYDTGNPDTTQLKPFLQAEAALGAMVGGETCDVNAPHALCASAGGQADVELSRFGYTYLNADYNHSVNNNWTPCFEEINKKLGYRLLLLNGEYPNTATAGHALTLQFNIKNEGWAPVINPRSGEFILRHSVTGQLYYALSNSLPTSWMPGNTYPVQQTFCLPAAMPAGVYDLLYHLPDAAPVLYGNPNYAIRLANENTWEPSTGYNKLLHQITIAAGGSGCSGFEAFGSNSPLPVEWLEFRAEWSGEEAVALYWRTGIETNVSHYEAERSLDAVHFQTIARIESAGNAASYAHSDRELPHASQGGYWYRIRAVDYDGRASYTPVQFVRSAPALRLSILGNSAGNSLSFRVDGAEGVFEYRLFAADGRVIAQGTAQYTANLQGVSAGFYFLEIISRGKRLMAKVPVSG